jgi:hypothetical protein
MKIINQWVAIIIQSDATANGMPIVESAFGPFDKASARQFTEQFNAEYDGSPWHATMRPLTLLQIGE